MIVKKPIIKDKEVVLLSIETKARELPGKVLLSCFIAEKGFKVIMTNYRELSLIRKTKAWLYIDRNTFARRFVFFKKIKFYGLKLVCIDEEGILWLNPHEYKRRINAKTNILVDMFFTWGEKQTELVKEVSSSIKTVETGNPRVDLLRPEFYDLYQSRVEYLRKEHGDFILLVSNFGTNNNFYLNRTEIPLIDFLVKEMRRHGLINSIEEEIHYRSYYDNRERVFEKVVKLMKFISIKFPNNKIVIRPHPSESHETWKRLMSDYPNIKVLFEGELIPWIIASKAVIHNSCTTGVEAALIGRKAIAYLPIDEPEYEIELANTVSAITTNEEQVIEFINESPIYQSVPNILDKHITSLTGKLACEKIADQIDGLYNRLSFKYTLFRFLFFRENLLSKMAAMFIEKFIQIINSLDLIKAPRKPKNIDQYKEQKLQKITAGECYNYLNFYKKIYPQFQNIIVVENDGNIEFSFNDTP